MELIGPNLEPFLSEFAAERGQVRVLMLVSPTWDMCLQGAARVATALQGPVASPVRILIAWVPMLPPDSLEAAEMAARHFPNATHFSDEDRRLASELGRVLGITSAQSIGAPGDRGLAWDVYLAYGPGKAWGGPPDFWMHQLAVEHAPRLDPDEFRRRIERLPQT